MLPKVKHTITEAAWQAAFAGIEQTVSKAEIDNAIDRALVEIGQVCKGKRCAIAWSGGKDSIALEWITRQAGIEKGIMALSNLEFNAFLDWLVIHQPPYLDIMTSSFDATMFVSRPEYLFPDNSDVLGKWYGMHQHRIQKEYAHAHKLDLMIMGRRKADSNYTGRGSNLYTNKDGTIYNPLADWSHEYIFAVLHYYQLPLPPTYRFPRGFKQGTGPWAWRNRLQSLLHSWNEIYVIEPAIVHQYAEIIPSAREYLSVKDNMTF